jgi:hypothetical protein
VETWRRYADAEGQELTVNEMIDFGRQMTPGKLIKSARHLHHELPVGTPINLSRCGGGGLSGLR